MKGYNFPYRPPRPPEKTKYLVGCRRCPNTWYEERMMSPDSPRINSASRCYDYCDKCITEEEKNEQDKT